MLFRSLSPAQIQKIEIVDKKARVTVEESQAPLAIGKGGVNVNLASKLTGFEIDIEQIKSDKPAEATPIEAEAKSVEAAQVEPETTQSVTEDIVATTEAPAEKVVEETPAETTPETPVEATTDTQTTSDAK